MLELDALALQYGCVGGTDEIGLDCRERCDPLRRHGAFRMEKDSEVHASTVQPRLNLAQLTLANVQTDVRIRGQFKNPAQLV
ncbi:hypothetical protein CG017_02320 [Burkholderia glumae]|nr:hypothetical protein KS03_3004 [Burkholderia glumae LMG 2196 = ATCC 33617]QKM54291.1 hypothetical protein CG017_02320 [Burkholderia glumae]